MAKITRFFENIEVTPAGLEIPNIISNKQFIHTGEIDQVIITVVDGGAASAEVQIRYERGVDDRDKLVYLFVDAPLPLFVDSHVDAQFSLVNPRTQGDLHFYMEADATCIVNIRIDMDINRLSGL